MRKNSILVLSIMLLAGLLSACGPALAQTPESNGNLRTLTVTGSAQVFLTPDIASISIGVHSENRDAVAAVADNSAKTAQVIEDLKAMGVEAKDIRTSNFSIYPNQVYTRDGEPRETTYVVNNTVSVTLRDIDQVGQVLNKVVVSGANNIYGIQFDVADKTAAISEARQAAIANARSTAGEIASAAGVTLGPIHTISFYGGAPTPFMDYAPRVAAEMDVPISIGEMTITVEVNVVYEIR
jgi:uncharacterized protein